jgi:serine/threonine protein kinase
MSNPSRLGSPNFHAATCSPSVPGTSFLTFNDQPNALGRATRPEQGCDRPGEEAAGQKLTDPTLFTEIGQVVGTLEYMSPEQAELNQLDIDTRSDIYSLGVLLYELLTGSTPLERKRLKSAAMLEVVRLIREEEPPRPSTRLSEAKETLPTVSAQQQTVTIKNNGPRLQGPLALVVPGLSAAAALVNATDTTSDGDSFLDILSAAFNLDLGKTLSATLTFAAPNASFSHGPLPCPDGDLIPICGDQLLLEAPARVVRSVSVCGAQDGGHRRVDPRVPAPGRPAHWR